VLTAALATRRARADKLGFDAQQISGQFPRVGDRPTAASAGQSGRSILRDAGSAERLDLFAIYVGSRDG
jgi:hypothetical protein